MEFGIQEGYNLTFFVNSISRRDISFLVYDVAGVSTWRYAGDWMPIVNNKVWLAYESAGTWPRRPSTSIITLRIGAFS